jgi:acylphosphatase
MKCLVIRISGNVQGVFFRASAREVANQLGIKGFIRNEPDGNVYSEAESEVEQLEKFIAWCKSGPPRARVERVEIAESDLKHFNSFEIIQ